MLPFAERRPAGSLSQFDDLWSGRSENLRFARERFSGLGVNLVGYSAIYYATVEDFLPHGNLAGAQKVTTDHR